MDAESQMNGKTGSGMDSETWAADPRKRRAYLMPPLTLAYIGDAVYELHVRTRLLELHPKQPAHRLHMMATHVVRASAQAATSREILQELDGTEEKVFRRGRNANPSTVPKNADMADYRLATGLEAVIGYLYAAGDADRLDELLGMCEKGWKL